MTRHHTIPPRRLLTIALICLLLGLVALSFVGCGESPTAPSESSRYLWAMTGVGCSPERPVPSVASAPDLEISGAMIDQLVPGRDVILVQWNTEKVNALFVKDGPFYALCQWWRP